MYLVQVLLPLYDNSGQAFPRHVFAQVRTELAERFGGVTAYLRSPAQGVWAGDDGRVAHDDVVMVEVMVDALDRVWWNQYRRELERRFRQDAIVARALPYETL